MGFEKTLKDDKGLKESRQIEQIHRHRDRRTDDRVDMHGKASYLTIPLVMLN